MKGIVVYYSGTGNNYKIGRAIYRGMKELMDCDVGSIKEIDPSDMGEYDVICIGSPIWFFREVPSVRLFIYNMPDMSGKLSFIYSVHGTMPLGIFHSMAPTLQRKGLRIIGWNDWFGANFYTLHAEKPYPLDGHPDEIDIEEAEDWGREMARKAQLIYTGEKNLIPEIPRGRKADPLFQPPEVITFFPKADKPHRTINMSKCEYPECSICVDNCVVKALDFSTNPPAFHRNRCINCCFCDHMCPQGAIEISEEELVRMRTNKKIDMTKCKYPGCTICIDHCAMNAIDFSVNPPVFKRSCAGDDLCWVICPEGAIEITNLDITHEILIPPPDGSDKEKELSDKATLPRLNILAQREAEGRFRRLVPKDQVGIYGKVMYMTRHPRFNIHELMQETPLPPDYGKPENE